jgi:thioredoxin 1
MSKNVIDVTDETFATEVLQSDRPVVVDFWAPWCGPCRMMAPVIESAAAALDGKVKFAKLNTDENVDQAMGFGVRAIPTMIVFNNGKEADRLVGYIPQAELLAKLRRHHEAAAGAAQGNA